MDLLLSCEVQIVSANCSSSLLADGARRLSAATWSSSLLICSFVTLSFWSRSRASALACCSNAAIRSSAILERCSRCCFAIANVSRSEFTSCWRASWPASIFVICTGKGALATVLDSKSRDITRLTCSSWSFFAHSIHSGPGAAMESSLNDK